MRKGTPPPAQDRTAPAQLPPAGLPGLDPAWSRLVTTEDAAGNPRTWHVLDTHASRPGAASPDDPGEPGAASPDAPVGTLLCVHGNPTWSYLWRDMLAQAPAGWRVVAVDHLGMGFSERTAAPRRLAERVSDLGALTDALGIDGPVVTLAHDWGGPISLGWALAHRDQLVGVVLTNTAVSQPPGSPVPALIALARTPGVLTATCVTTTTFLDGTLGLGHPRPVREVRAGYRAPYRSAARRAAIGAFVEDIPLRPDHPSAATLEAIAAGLADLAEIPVLLLWGPRDPVFSDRYLRDLVARLPHAQVHRFEGAGHLLAEDRDIASPVTAFIQSLSGPHRTSVPALSPESTAQSTAESTAESTAGSAAGSTAGPRVPLWAELESRATDAAGGDRPAIVQLGKAGSAPVSISFTELGQRVHAVAAGLTAHGVSPGDRVALLVPPGPELATLVYACWRIGAVIVLADAGLGVQGLTRALRGAGPQHLIGIPRALAAARVLRWPGRVIAREALASPGTQQLPDPPQASDEAAILFTSGATGPPKGVVYRHEQLEAQRDALRRTYSIGPDDRLVAAFAPFALYGPALGITSAVPDMDVTAPATLQATALADAVDAVDATLVFSSPAALVNVVATAERLNPRQHRALGGVRLLLSAGAPVPVTLLQRVRALMPNASLHTPYGMTEALPVTDIDLDEILRAGTGEGVCVGHPVDGVELAISPLDPHGRAEPELVDKPWLTGEICVRAAHVKDRYDRLWITQQASTAGSASTAFPASGSDRGWHRTGDVGHLDDAGRLWVEGRLQHVITTPHGVLTPVGVEQRVEALGRIRQAAVVGVGPVGTQAVAVVVVLESTDRRPASGLADPATSAAVRAAAGVEVAAVLVVPALPVDIRHNSKIDRTAVAAWAGVVLSGGRAGSLARRSRRLRSPLRRSPIRHSPIRRG